MEFEAAARVTCYDGDRRSTASYPMRVRPYRNRTMTADGITDRLMALAQESRGAGWN
jgi:hypothetical protein